MHELSLEQAAAVVQASNQVRWLAQSPAFTDEWKSLLEPHCIAQGRSEPAGRAGEAVLLYSLDKRQVAICRSAPLGGDPAAMIGLQWLVLSETDYNLSGGDPFCLADACPPNWEARGTLPAATLPWPARRTVAQVCAVLKRDDGPMLLGAAQAIVDGGRLAWIRPQPATDLVRALWMLLPTSTRSELRPASFAVSAVQAFDVVVVPQVNKGDFDRSYLSEAQAENYPEGRYELSVQTAAEAGDQDSLDALFARRSRKETWRLGLWLAGSLAVLVLLMTLFKALTGR